MNVDAFVAVCFQSEAEDATCDSTGSAPGGGHGVSSTAMATRMHDTTTAAAGVALPPAKRVCYPPYRSVPTQGYAKTKDPPWLQQRMTYNTDAQKQAGSVDSINGRVTSDHPLTFRGVRSMKHKNSSHQDGMRRSSSLHDLPTSPSDDDPTFVALGRNFRSRSRESLVVGGGFLPPGAPLHAKQRPVSACCFADSLVCNANNTDSTTTAASVSSSASCDDTHRPRTLFEALVSSDPPSTPNAKHDCYVRLASVPKLRTVNRYVASDPCDRRRLTPLNGLTLTNTVANKARFWEAQSKRTVAAHLSVSGTSLQDSRNVPATPGKADVCCARVQSFPRSPSTPTTSTKASPLLHASPRLAPASLPASRPPLTTSLRSVDQDSGNFNAHGRPNAMASNPRSWRSSERSQSPPPVWNSADSLWQSQPRSPTSSLLLNGRSKNETDEYKVRISSLTFILTETSIYIYL